MTTALRRVGRSFVSEARRARPRLEVIKATMERTEKPRSELMWNMTTSEIIEGFPYLRIPQLVKSLFIIAHIT